MRFCTAVHRKPPLGPEHPDVAMTLEARAKQVRPRRMRRAGARV